MREYYLIQVETYNCNYQYKYITNTLEDALSKIQENPTHYTNWYDSKGNCTIVKVDENFKVLRAYNIIDGKLEGETKNA